MDSDTKMYVDTDTGDMDMDTDKDIATDTYKDTNSE
jgi:hypothetical protein